MAERESESLPIALTSAVDILKERGVLKDENVPPLGQIFDFSYLNAALKELGLPAVAEYEGAAH